MRAPAESDISRLLRGIDIPPCPEVLSALLKELESGAPNATRVSRLIAQDVALAAGVMKVANSSFFQPARQVTSLADALNFLGFGDIFSTLVRALLQKSLSDATGNRLERYWDSAAYCAAACGALAESLPGTSRENAYCFGLFHDCGIPLLMKRFPDEYRETLRLANRDPQRGFCAIEEARHGTHHAVIGHLVSRTWGLPDPVSQAILCHHDYGIFEKREGIEAETLTLIALNLIAEHVVGLALREVSDAEWPKARHLAAEHFDLSLSQLNDLVFDTQVRIDRRQAA